jgi:predicted ATPase
MRISKLTVRNYKSFYDAAELVFRPGFNVITGQNNSGKTALLETLSLRFPCVPHRSLRTIPVEGGTPPQVSEVDISVTLSHDEIVEFLFSGGNETATVNLPVVSFNSVFAQTERISSERQLIDWFLATASHSFHVRLRRHPNNTEDLLIPSLPSYGHYDVVSPPENVVNFVQFWLMRDGRITHIQVHGASREHEIGRQIAPLFSKYVYLFKAERFNLARRQFGGSNILLSDASNLPEVLNRLQGNRERFALFVRLVRSVLPQVRDVTVLPADAGGQVEIRVWTSNLDRVDLTKPLDACGTGIGQVLAILYVAVNSPHPGVILIDEPQSFLHPGAARKLMQILRDYPQHQYICSTHSAALISSTEPETITVTRLVDDRTELEQVDPDEPASLQTCLAEVGARLSDVFGADQILWVEGRTEETCFPIILRDIAGKRLMGTIIVGLRSTGELEGGDAERVVDIYSRLSRAKSLMPPAVGFVFDQEGRTEEAQADIIRRTGPTVKFLPRRMYENYLLEAEAISRVLSSLDGEHADQYTAERVHALLDAECRRDENFRPFAVPEGGGNWRNTIDAARALKAVFGTMSEHRIRYDKVRDGEALTKDIIANSPDQLGELSRFLLDLLPEG